LKQQVLELSRAGQARVFTDPVASPTGFPFKVIQVDGSLSETGAYQERQRICDLGYLRHLYRRDDGTVGYRCPAEPVNDYLAKGGALADTEGRKCVCNGLPSSVGLGQARGADAMELPLLTAGNEVANVAQFLPPGASSYTAAEVVARLLAPLPAMPLSTCTVAAGGTEPSLRPLPELASTEA